MALTSHWAVHAQDRPLVLALPADRPIGGDLLDLLRVQLAGTAEVRIGEAIAGGSLAGQVDLAVAAAEQSGALLAFWSEIADGGDEGRVTAILHVVGRGPELALVRVIRVTGAPGPALDRALALKIAELLDAVLAASDTAARDAGALIAPVVARTDAAPPRPTDRWRFALEIGALGVVGLPVPALQAGLRVALGARWTSSGTTLEIVGAAQLFTPARWASAGAAVEVIEIEALLGARLLASPVAPIHLGAFFELGTRIAEGTGVASDGARGSEMRVLPLLDLGLEARVSLVAALDLALGVGVEIASGAPRWAVDEAVVLEQGYVRPIARLSIVAALP